MRTLRVCLLLLALFTAACGHGRRSDPLDDTSQLAQLEQLPAPSGISAADWEALKDALAGQIGKAASDAPATDASASVLTLTDNGGTVTLNWSYASQGDYDQNGEVNINDLSALGANFRESTGGGPFPYESALSVVDGDGNGEINISDVTPIAANLGNSLTGYRVYSSTVFTDLPLGNNSGNGPGAQLLGTVLLSTATGSGRKLLTYETSANPAGNYYWVRPTDGATVGTASKYTVPAGDTLPPSGGAVNLNGIQLAANPQDLTADIKFTITSVAPPPGLPSDATALAAYEITPDQPDNFDAAVRLTIPYDDSTLGGDEAGVFVLHYTGSEYEPMTVLARDPVNNTITVETRTFSTITVMSVYNATFNAMATDYNVGFDIATNGWNIRNFGSYVAPGGNCLGMSAYACWFFKAHEGESLATKFSKTGGDETHPVSIAHLMATRAHMAQTQGWTNFASAKNLHWDDFWNNAANVMKDIKYDLSRFGKPLVLVMRGPGFAHACVVYGWDSQGLLFYNVNFPEDGPQHLSLGPDGHFIPWAGYTKFGYVTQTSCGRSSDFQSLTTEGEDGFTTSSQIELEKPEALAFVETYLAQIKGTVSGGLSGSTELACYVNGQRQLVRISGDAFNSYIPAKLGQNTVVLIAGENEETKPNGWYKNCATLVRTFTSANPELDLSVTLTWDKPLANCDLFVYEPDWFYSASPDKVAYPNEFSDGVGGGFSDSGLYHHGRSWEFGPELVTLNANEGNNKLLSGNYMIRVHYEGQGSAVQGEEPLHGPVSGTVTVITHQGLPNQTLNRYPFTIPDWDPDRSNKDFEPQQGPYWAEFPFVRLTD